MEEHAQTCIEASCPVCIASPMTAFEESIHKQALIYAEACDVPVQLVARVRCGMFDCFLNQKPGEEVYMRTLFSQEFGNFVILVSDACPIDILGEMLFCEMLGIVLNIKGAAELIIIAASAMSKLHEMVELPRYSMSRAGPVSNSQGRWVDYRELLKVVT